MPKKSLLQIFVKSPPLRKTICQIIRDQMKKPVSKDSKKSVVESVPPEHYNNMHQALPER